MNPYYPPWDEGGWNEPEVFRVYPKESCQPRNADIVLVHGFNGHYVHTWRPRGGTFWPAWLPENVPNVRVLSVGYYAGVSLSEGPLFDNVSRGVLTALINADVGTAPIIFICHSLGGLIVKRVLEIAFDERVGNIWDSTRGVVFFSTPHGGAQLANFASVLGENRLIRYLRDKMGEGNLEEFQQRFSAKIKPRIDSGNMHVFNFFEEKRFKRLKVVTPESARRGFEYLESAPVPADHFWMVKFPRKQNFIYVKLCRMLTAWLNEDVKSFPVDDRGTEYILNQQELTIKIPSSLLRDAGLMLLGATLIILLFYAWGTRS